MKTIHIYSDESRHKAERFMLLGGIWIEKENVLTARNALLRLREKYGYINSNKQKIHFLGEFKWGKVSEKYYDLYKELVDIFFGWVDRDTARFCCMLIDTHNPIIQKINNIAEDGYFKFLYQFYLHNSKIPAIYKIYPDSISNSTIRVNLPKLDSSLDRSFQIKFIPLLNPSEKIGEKGLVNNITPINSKSSDFIQVVDVVLGAIGYLQNRLFQKPEANKARVRLMKYIFEKMALSGAILLSGKTYYIAKATKFNIWKFQPRS